MTYTSDANDAPDWQLAVNINAALLVMRTTAVFVAIGGESVRSVSAEGVIIRKTSDADETGVFATEQLPALITTMQGMQSDPSEGSNIASQDVYSVLIQIADIDSGDKVRGLRTYSYWANHIARRLNNPDLVCIDPLSPGVEYEFKHVSIVNAPDRKKWLIDKNFQKGVLVQCTVREGFL